MELTPLVYKLCACDLQAHSDLVRPYEFTRINCSAHSVNTRAHRELGW